MTDWVSRMTMVWTLHHQSQGEEARSVGSAYDEVLRTGHEMYSRRCTASEEWTPLDFGWLPAEDVIAVVIENLEGRHLQVNPTEEERESMSMQVIEIRLDETSTNYVLVPPRHAVPLELARYDCVEVRCLGPETRYRVTAVPR